MPGILKADEILKAKHAVGLLIGGCARAIAAGHTLQELETHKDVDVVVLSHGFRPKAPFEGGIDWWRRSRPFRYENGNGVVLSWSPPSDAPAGTSPGLLVPDRETMASILGAEWRRRHPKKRRPWNFAEALRDKFYHALVETSERKVRLDLPLVRLRVW